MRYEDNGIRSAVMLQELGLHLSSDEYLAIRFHMYLNNKKDHPLYEDARKNRLRYLIRNADGKSASAIEGYNIPQSLPKHNNDLTTRIVDAFYQTGCTVTKDNGNKMSIDELLQY